jgi:membrane protease YdiL (CAAX protease family)
VISVILVFGVQYSLFTFGLIPDEAKKINAVHMFIIIASQAAVFLGLVVFLQKKLGFAYFGFGDEISGKDLFFGFTGLIGVNMISAVFMNLMGTFPDQFKDFDPELLRSNLYLFMFTVALLAPIYEEVIFRGYILGMLVPEAGQGGILKSLPAMLFTSILFMVAHIDDIHENYFIGLPLFLLGLYFSFWAIRKKGVMLTVILHVTQNFMAALAMLYQAKQL